MCNLYIDFFEPLLYFFADLRRQLVLESHAPCDMMTRLPEPEAKELGFIHAAPEMFPD